MSLRSTSRTFRNSCLSRIIWSLLLGTFYTFWIVVCFCLQIAGWKFSLMAFGIGAILGSIGFYIRLTFFEVCDKCNLIYSIDGTDEGRVCPKCGFDPLNPKKSEPAFCPICRRYLGTRHAPHPCPVCKFDWDTYDKGWKWICARKNNDKTWNGEFTAGEIAKVMNVELCVFERLYLERFKYMLTIIAEIVTCSNCGVKNRVNTAKVRYGYLPNCEKCQTPLTGAKLVDTTIYSCK